jgi:fucose 4-O-acetylase-like acetyltransferase
MMPLFLFIMGKFSRKSKKAPLIRAKKMFKMFIIMQILTTIYYVYVLNIISLEKGIFVPRYTLWYLLTCTYFYLIDYILLKSKFKYSFTISIILGLFGGFLPFINNTLSISRTLGFLPFYVLGFYESELDIEKKVITNKKYFIIAGILITIIFIFNQNFFLAKDMYLKYNYYAYSTPFVCFLKRFLLYVIFFIYSGFIYSIFPTYKTIFLKLGDKTMYIYLSHGIILKTLDKYDLFYPEKIFGTILTYLLVTVFGIIIYYIFKFIKERKDEFEQNIEIRKTKA